jgi:hyperosmotically inducible protein
MKAFFAFVLGMAVGLLMYWYFSRPDSQIRTAKAVDPDKVESTQAVNRTAGSIQDELARTSKVIRENAKEAGGAIAAVADNTRITADINAKLVKDPVLSAVAINVDTSQGVVTLSGTVPSYSQISNAIQLALETDGVQKVVSELQVAGTKPAAE